MRALIHRHLLLFFRDRTAVFFSFLAVFIVLGLYVLFLGDMMIKGLDVPGAAALMNSWVMAGILAITPVTAALGALGVMVEDRSSSRIKDLQSAPVTQGKLTSAYLVSAMMIACMMTIMVLVFAQIYIVATGGAWFSLLAYMKLVGIVILTVFVGCVLLFWISSFVRSQNAYSTLGSIVGTLIGFLTGIYIPIGTLPEFVQVLIKLFPISHAAALARQVMVEDAAAIAFEGAPAAARTQFELDMGIAYAFGDWQITPMISVLYLVVIGLIFFGLSLLAMKRKNKNSR